MKKTRIIQASDIFCGAGGTSTGLLEACADARLGVDLLAINHWDVAIATHQRNHPRVRHVCKSIESINPRTLVPGGHLDILVASPECTHHSNARGGKPMSDQSRASAWHILYWAESLTIDNILIENVKEFREWGPLYPADHSEEKLQNRPIPEKKGQYFELFLKNLRALGYRVDYRLLRAADYGDATTRVRLFIQARKGRRKLTWPERTHAAPSELALYPGLKPWRTAREIIDWKIAGESIYRRKKPLSPNTMKRILAGLQKFSGLPFVMVNRTNNEPHSVDEPVHTLCTGNHMALCQPFLVIFRNNQTAQSLDEPLRTQTANNGGNFALIEPFIISAGGPEVGARSVDEPMNTVLTRDPMALCEPFIVGVGGPEGQGRPQSVDDPLGTVLAENHRGICEPFILKQYSCSKPFDSLDEPLSSVTAEFNHHGLVEPYLTEYHGAKSEEDHRVRSVDDPLGTQDTSNRYALVRPFLVPFFGERDGQKPRCHDVNEPLPAVTSHGAGGLCEPFLIAYHGTAAEGSSVDEPLRTIDTRDRYGLVESGLIEKGDRVYLLDIRFRMLKPHELAAAHSFPRDYQFEGNQDAQVKQVGNSVPKELAKALVREIIKR